MISDVLKEDWRPGGTVGELNLSQDPVFETTSPKQGSLWGAAAAAYQSFIREHEQISPLVVPAALS